MSAPADPHNVTAGRELIEQARLLAAEGIDFADALKVILHVDLQMSLYKIAHRPRS